MISLKKGNKELIPKVNLRQTRLRHLSESYMSQILPEYKSKQEYEGTSKAIPKNWITKLETKFPEREKKMISLENKLQVNVSNQSS